MTLSELLRSSTVDLYCLAKAVDTLGYQFRTPCTTRYKNNTVVLHHLIEYVVTALRMHKHQDVVVKHMESSS